jgi:hypothetical protein
MNQHKADADHVAIAKTLAASENSASLELNAKMRALRDSHLRILKSSCQLSFLTTGRKPNPK